MFDEVLVQAIRELTRGTRQPATTLAIAGRVCLSDRQTRRWLVALENRGTVQRVGLRRGWQLPPCA